MKLYTEEQVRSMLDKMNVIYSLEDLTPIQLPSDEEIEKTAKEKHIGLSRDVANYRGCFEQGAKWIKDKIQGGNK